MVQLIRRPERTTVEDEEAQSLPLHQVLSLSLSLDKSNVQTLIKTLV